MRTAVLRLLGFVLLLVVAACPGNSGRIALPRQLVACLDSAHKSMDVTMTGSATSLVSGSFFDVRASATLSNPSDSTVTWTIAGTPTPDDPLTGRTGSGGVTTYGPVSAPDSIDVRVSYPYDGKTVTIQGRIRPFPKPCTGSGTWTASRSGVQVGSGTWSIP